MLPDDPESVVDDLLCELVPRGEAHEEPGKPPVIEEVELLHRGAVVPRDSREQGAFALLGGAAGLGSRIMLGRYHAGQYPCTRRGFIAAGSKAPEHGRRYPAARRVRPEEAHRARRGTEVAEIELERARRMGQSQAPEAIPGAEGIGHPIVTDSGGQGQPGDERLAPLRTVGEGTAVMPATELAFIALVLQRIRCPGEGEIEALRDVPAHR